MKPSLSQRLDRSLGRLFHRAGAVVFAGLGAGCAAGALSVFRDGQWEGVIPGLAAALFLWLAVRAWRSKRTFGDALEQWDP